MSTQPAANDAAAGRANNDLLCRESMGFMYLAKRPCGKVSAAAWDDDDWGVKEKRKTLAEWLERGDTVEKVERFTGDPEPDWICRPGCHECKKAAA